MTAQIPDVVRYRERDYAIAGVAGSGLFDPADWGIEPVATSTANWRGFSALYELKEERLHLKELSIGIADDNGETPSEPVRIFDTLPKSDRGPFGTPYEFDNAPLPFSGGLLLGDRFIHELYVHMGFHPAWKYEEVLELIFADGRLEKVTDHSAKMAEIRSEIVSGARKDPDGSPEDLIGWIDNAFQLNYGRSYL
jgi:hypothetical protein